MTDLGKFCGEAMPFDTLTPFVLRGYEYATDSRIIARQPSSEPDSQGRKLPKPEEFFAGHAAADWKPLSQRELSVETCDCGTGEVECECCGHRSTCEWCQGTGAHHVWIGRYAVQVKYDAMIRSLPGDVEYAEGDKCILFRCGDVDGVIMPVCEEGQWDTPITREAPQ